MAGRSTFLVALVLATFFVISFLTNILGALVPDIITSFSCRYNGAEIFRADFFPAIAANPFISFFTIARDSGNFEFEWIGDKGFSETASASISVE